MSLIFEKRGKVAIIQLNRPKAMNSIDPETEVELKKAWDEFQTDPNLWVAIFTGTGEKAFCTGSDLKKTMPPKESFAQITLNGSGKRNFVPPFSQYKPIICAVNGYCLGGGLEMALMCDFIIGSESSSYGLTEVKIGSMPGLGGTQRLSRRIPYSAAMKMLLTAERIDAQEAFRLGLIAEVVPNDQLLDRAIELAEKICENAPLSVRAVKMAVNEGLEMNLEQGISFENLAWGMLRDTKDRLEGRKAFAEKRKPDYRGE